MNVTNSRLKVLSKNRTVHLSLSFMLLASMSTMVQSAVTTYNDEAIYLADLSAYTQAAESFEGTAWDSVRSAVLDPQVLPSISNLGLTWKSRFFPDGGVTTSDGGGFVHDGSWQFYASPHGGYGLDGTGGLDCTTQGVCGDGLTVNSTGAGTLFGVGGWFTGVSGPEIKFLLNDIEVLGAGGTGGMLWQFFGVIDTDGFTTVEIMDSSGTLGDQNFIFADDFTFGVTTVPLPATVWLFGSGLLGLIGVARSKRQSWNKIEIDTPNPAIVRDF